MFHSEFDALDNLGVLAMVTNADFLIAGGGIVGISIARELQKRFPKQKIVVLEKEPVLGEHATGRNSGVIHAGFYYSADSLKAKLTRDGNKALTEFCIERGIALNRCGKLVVAKNESELSGLDELLRRSKANQVEIESISFADAKKIEPRVKTFERALFSPTTSSVSAVEVLGHMEKEFIEKGGVVELGAKYLRRHGENVVTGKGEFSFGHFINAAGLYADVVARDFGFSKRYRIVPFKGLYLYSEQESTPIRTHIYPVPNLGNPFLGVHFTVQVDGKVKIGPTAIPAFWREQYQGFDNFSFTEFSEILFRNAGLFFSSGFDFSELAIEELKKYSRKRLVNLASTMATDVDPSRFLKWGKAGIRAQLMDVNARTLELDFVVEGDEHSTHILNAVSPAFTCCISFAKWVCSRFS